MNLLVFNLAVDTEDATLGHTTSWINAVARRVEHVSVVTMRAGRVEVEPNVAVYSLGKELGRSEPGRLVTYYRSVWKVLRERRIDACFAHMAPLFAALFAPLAAPRRIPTLLWFAHTSTSPVLRVAHALVDRCATPTPASFPFPSSKLVVLGHGIDTEVFRPPAEPPPSYGDTAVSIGRITPIKHLEEMLEAVAVLRSERQRELRLQLVGGPATASDHGYLERLRRAAGELAIDDLVTFSGAVPYRDVPPHYRAGALALNLSDGAMDKAILEAMASGCLPVSRNPAFRELAAAHGLDWLVPGAGAHGVADCVLNGLERSRVDRPAVAADLRRIVVEHHSLDRLAGRIVDQLAALAERPGERAPSIG